MSARLITSQARARRRVDATLRRRRRQRVVLVLGVACLAALLAAAALPRLPDVVRELRLPLAREDIIRQQASDKGLDPSLLAAVIYAESRFRDRTSHAGARGLMQITPGTARYIARLSGGTEFEQGDLATPQINISYGAFYLRYLLERYGDNTILALAAYNGGEGNVDRWLARTSVAERTFASTRSRSPRRASTSTACSTRGAATATSTRRSSGCRGRAQAARAGRRSSRHRVRRRRRTCRRRGSTAGGARRPARTRAGWRAAQLGEARLARVARDAGLDVGGRRAVLDHASWQALRAAALRASARGRAACGARS